MSMKKQKDFKSDAINFLEMVILCLSRVMKERNYHFFHETIKISEELMERKERLLSTEYIQILASVVGKMKIYANDNVLISVLNRRERAKIIAFCRKFETKLNLVCTNNSIPNVKRNKRKVKKRLVRT